MKITRKELKELVKSTMKEYGYIGTEYTRPSNNANNNDDGTKIQKYDNDGTNFDITNSGQTDLDESSNRYDTKKLKLFFKLGKSTNAKLMNPYLKLIKTMFGGVDNIPPHITAALTKHNNFKEFLNDIAQFN